MVFPREVRRGRLTRRRAAARARRAKEGCPPRAGRKTVRSPVARLREQAERRCRRSQNERLGRASSETTAPVPGVAANGGWRLAARPTAVNYIVCNTRSDPFFTYMTVSVTILVKCNYVCYYNFIHTQPRWMRLSAPPLPEQAERRCLAGRAAIATRPGRDGRDPRSSYPDPVAPASGLQSLTADGSRRKVTG